MKTLFIHAADTSNQVKLTKEKFDSLPKPVGLVTTVQFEHALEDLHKQFRQSILVGTILGCRIYEAEKANVASFLFIGTGEFHPLMIALKTAKPVFVLDPYDNRLSQIDRAQIDAIKRRQKVNLVKFLQAETIGILVTTKPGQQNLTKALELQKKLSKRSYLFLDDTFNLDSLQNFPFIDCFVNTACPRLAEDSSIPIINIDDILN